jgi:hypothetical protein
MGVLLARGVVDKRKEGAFLVFPANGNVIVGGCALLTHNREGAVPSSLFNAACSYSVRSLGMVVRLKLQLSAETHL